MLIIHLSLLPAPFKEDVCQSEFVTFENFSWYEVFKHIRTFTSSVKQVTLNKSESLQSEVSHLRLYKEPNDFIH